MHRELILACILIMGGCVTVHQHPGTIPRMHLGVPETCAGMTDPVRITYQCPHGHTCVSWTNVPVYPDRCYINCPEKNERDGNTYKVEFYNLTNAPLVNTGNPEWDAMSLYIRTNKWPSKRVHIDLSIDNGTNYIRRIGYGIPVSGAGIGGEFMWSPPKDYAFLTEQARLRNTTLDGSPFDNGPTNYSFNLRPGQYVVSDSFALRGAVIDAPTWGQITYYTGLLTMTFRQAGGGAVWDVGWMAEDDQNFHPMGTISNVVAGINTGTISNSIPRSASVELIIRSVSDPLIRGYSKPFEVD